MSLDFYFLLILKQEDFGSKSHLDDFKFNTVNVFSRI